MIRINGVDYPSAANDSSIPGKPYGTYEMINNPNIYEPQRTNNFELIVTGIDGIKKAGFLDTDTSSVSTVNNGQEIIRMAVSRAFIPNFTQGVISVKRGNSTVKYAGVPEFSSGTVALNDYIGADVVGVLTAWQNLSYNVRTEKVGLASDYKKLCYLVEYSPDYQQVRKFKLHGCWISGLSYDELSSESNNVMRVSATIQYDRAELDVTEL